MAPYNMANGVIKSDLQIGTLSSVASYVSSYYLAKSGKTCELIIRTSGIPSSGWANLGYLPEDFTPDKTGETGFVRMLFPNDGVNGFGACVIQANGKIEFYHKLSGSQNFTGTVTYLTK